MRLRDEQGFTLVELLIGMSLTLLILMATLSVFDGFYRSAYENNARFDAAETARNALDTQARQLRNLGKRLNNAPVIDRAGGYDLIFQTSDPSRTWVRYCLDTSTAPASSSRGRLWAASLSLPDATVSHAVTAAMRAGCPGSGWTKTAVVADHVTNRIGGVDRPLFSFGCAGRTSTCTTDAAQFDQIVEISAQTIVDSTPGVRPAELKVASAVFLRNQNQAPVVSFVATPTASRTVQLNASGSGDYEGRTLTLYWFQGTMPSAIACDAASVTSAADGRRLLWGGELIGDGITLSHTFAAGDGTAAQNIGLVGCDPGDRYGSAGVPPGTSIAVAIPA